MIGLLAVGRSLVAVVRAMFSDPRTRGLVTLVGALIAGGTVFYRQVEDFGWVDSFYFTIITLTTVGYGDVSPQTTAGKLFTAFFVLVGVGLVVVFVSEVASRLVANRNSEEDS